MAWVNLMPRGRSLQATYDEGEAGIGEPPALTTRRPARATSRSRTESLRARAVSAGPTTGGIALGAAAAGVLALTVATAVLGAGSTIGDHPAVFVTLRTAGCIMVIALAIGLNGASGRMAAVVVAAAGCLALTGLTAVDAPLAFAVGRIGSTLAVLAVAYMCFAYPTGRIEDRPSRWLIAGSAIGMGGLLAANLLLSDVPPVAGPFVRCSGAACPSNPLNLISVGPTVARALSTSQALVTAGGLALTAVTLARRALRATALQRRSLAPLLCWAATAAVSYGLFVSVRALDKHAPVLIPAAIVVAAIIAAMPLALALAIGRGRVFAMNAMERLIGQLETESDLAGLQQQMAHAFGDPQLQLLFWRADDERYVDVGAGPVDVLGRSPAAQHHPGHARWGRAGAHRPRSGASV